MASDRSGRPEIISALRADSLREKVTRALEAAVVAGEMEPGVIYSAPALAERFGVSATPVRNRGFRVMEVSEADLDQISQIRLLLEVPVMGQVAKLLTPQRAAELSELGQLIEAAAERGDLIQYLDCDRQFHSEMVSIIGNPRLTDLVDRLRRQARLFGLQQLADTGRLLASAQEHRAMIRMLQTGDVAASESLMSAHIGHTRGLWAGRSDAGRPGKDIGRS